MFWKPGKLQSYKIEGVCMFDVERYLTMHKSFVSTSLNIIHPRYTFHSAIPIGRLVNYTKMQWAQSPRDRAQIGNSSYRLNFDLDKKKNIHHHS
jgi:hypothetical protein